MGIYLDNQASTPIDPRVKAVMIEVMDQHFANPSSESHSAGWEARKCVEDARTTIAEAIQCDPDEIIFTSGATEADNIGVLGAALGAHEGRCRLLIGATEHKAVLEAALAAERFGFSVELLPVDDFGMINLTELENRLDETVAVVSVMLVNNEIGTIQSLEALVDVSAAAGAFVHTDATQAPTAMNVNVRALGVDAASFSSHKIYGPKGVGALYLSAAAPWKPKSLLFGGGQERGYRPGTLPTQLCAGFAEAFRLVTENGEGERARIAQLRDRFASMLEERAIGFRLTANAPQRHPGNLHCRFEGHNAEDLLARLQPDVFAATGSACTSGFAHHSHVLKAIGQTQEVASEGIRFSLGRFTTHEDVVNAVRHIANHIGTSEAALHQ